MEQLWKNQENNNQNEIFTSFNIEEQENRQRKLFDLLKNEVHINPDIQSLWKNIFWSEDAFFSWYLSPDNRWGEYGISIDISKIDALRLIQNMDSDIVKKWISAFGGEFQFYWNLLRYDRINKYCINYKTIPLLFPRDIFDKHLLYFEYWAWK